jgi:hypothetical protein
MRIRELAVPLQALLAMLICASLGWMVYTMAFFDPDPPSAAEVYLLETQDAEMPVLKTAAALTVEALFFGPTQILMPVTGPSVTPTPAFTSTVRAVFTLVSVPTASATVTRVFVQVPTARRDDRSDPAAATATPQPPTLEPTATVEITEPPTEPPLTDTPAEPTATEPPAVDTPDPTSTEPPAIDTPANVPVPTEQAP